MRENARGRDGKNLALIQEDFFLALFSSVPFQKYYFFSISICNKQFIFLH